MSVYLTYNGMTILNIKPALAQNSSAEVQHSFKVGRVVHSEVLFADLGCNQRGFFVFRCHSL